jgi:hypothetical protein
VAQQIPGGYKTDGTRKKPLYQRVASADTEISTMGGQQRNLMQEMARNVGLKIQPIEVDMQEQYMEWEKKKALTTLLQERGVLKEFTRPYVPVEGIIK